MPIARPVVRLAAAGAALLATASAFVATGASAVAAHPPGPVGSSILLDTGHQYDGGYDEVTDRSGTAYIGWIADTSSLHRAVHLCTLPAGATTCSGGIQVIDSLGASSASGLRVLLTSTGVDLVWFHDTSSSPNGPENARIAEATAAHGLHLTSATDVASAPSFGSLLDARIGPGGAVWTLTYSGVSSTVIRVRPGFAAAETSMHAPWAVGFAQLAFSGSTGIVAAQKYGAITTAVAYATTTGTSSSAFHSVAKTWAVASNAALATTPHGLRLVASIDNSSYRPALAAWNGHAFGTAAVTADTNTCGPKTHDSWTDASGRLLDASWECNTIAVTNYADAAHAAVVRIKVSGTPTLAPQISSSPSGEATIVYSTDISSTPNLRVLRVRLPDATRIAQGSASGGTVAVRGPLDCLPPVSVGVAIGTHPASGYHTVSHSLRLGGATVTGTSIDGATLKPATTYHLYGSAVYAKGTHRSGATVTLTFHTC